MVKGKIGLEIHSYVLTKEKLFCTCKASREKGLKENTYICPICTGQPGAKPMLPNENAVRKAVAIGLMLNCKINEVLKWQRKHYDWPDLPKGYQDTISGAYAIPIGEKGEFSRISIWSMHLEEDPASWDPETGCVDYNRSGLPLVEIITAPEFTTSEEVVNWLKKLIHSLSYLKAIDKNAGIKVDVNISLSGKTERVEVKNVSSIESIGKAIDYELVRQSKEGSEKETRRFDARSGKTVRMRGKEEAEDYRFITDPDLSDIVLDKKLISDVKKDLPESPEEKLKKLVKKYKIDKYNASVLARNIDVVEFFESVSEKIESGFALHWITGPLLRLLNDNKTSLDRVDIRVEHFIELLNLVKKGKITELQGKRVLKGFYSKSYSLSEKGGVKGKITGKKELEKIIEGVLKKNKKAVDDYKKGEKSAFNYLMGEIMRASDRRADFRIVREVLERLLKN